MEVLQLSVSKRRLNSSSKSAKLRSRSVDNNQRRSPGKLHLSSCCNLRIINRRNSSLSSSRSVDNIRPRQTMPKQQMQHEDKQQTKQQPLQQQEEERRQSPPKQ
jgi:hypothetical protein